MRTAACARPSAVFRGAVFRGAVFRGAVFRGAVFRGAVFRGAVFRGAVFRGVQSAAVRSRRLITRRPARRPSAFSPSVGRLPVGRRLAGLLSIGRGLAGRDVSADLQLRCLDCLFDATLFRHDSKLGGPRAGKACRGRRCGSAGVGCVWFPGAARAPSQHACSVDRVVWFSGADGALPRHAGRGWRGCVVFGCGGGPFSTRRDRVEGACRVRARSDPFLCARWKGGGGVSSFGRGAGRLSTRRAGVEGAERVVRPHAVADRSFAGPPDRGGVEQRHTTPTNRAPRLQNRRCGALRAVGVHVGKCPRIDDLCEETLTLPAQRC
ncbi:pentapeptide repeat-containing protein [Jidongwangia harbinensis]|uniref:pentapeptide repeat-containing protein n=1 Tax=Jidongwangia harbinensis TaxID=2878561 RepID=UPI001CDA0356|nr:pentapeptide repeat-containing protein [Jidongwangia harbinensis]